MKNIFLLCFMTFISFSCMAKSATEGSSALTWRANGGRFGDDITSYARAKSLSLKYGLPLLCPPFDYSDQLMLHENEALYTPDCLQRFARTKQLLNVPLDVLLNNNNNTLYVCRWRTKIEVAWSDPALLAELKRNIVPRYEIEKVAIPDGVVSVAVHVRNGGTFAADTAYEKERCPLRFVPEEFFIAQVERLAQMFPEENLYVFIFTDDQNPKKMAKRFKNKLNNPRISFDYRKENNSHKTNVLEDFFSMMDFDCLIRPGSQFTRWVHRLGNNKVVIFPQSIKEVAPGKKVIDTIKIKSRANVDEKWKTQLVVIA